MPKDTFSAKLVCVCVSIEAKKAVPTPPDDSGEIERDDELPTVVVLRQGDLSQDEFLKNRERMKEDGIKILINRNWN